MKKLLLLSALAALAVGTTHAQTVVYRENFTYDATNASTLAQMGWSDIWDGPFSGTTHTGYDVAQASNTAGTDIAFASSVASSPAVADAVNGLIYLDMIYRNPPNDTPRAVLLSTTEVAGLSLSSSDITEIRFSAHDYGFGNEAWAEPFTGQVALQIGGTWYVSNTQLGVTASATFQELSLDVTSGTWGTIADPAVALSFSGTGALAAGTVQAAGVLVTQPTSAYLAFDQFTIAIPEPSSLILLGVGGLAALIFRRRRQSC